MSQTADVVIVGAGIIGLNAALQIARRSHARVIVLEKGSGLGEGSTGASSAVCRFRYSRPEMVQLATDGIRAYRNWGEYTRLVRPRAHYHNDGVLWLATDLSDWASQEASRLNSFGVTADVLTDDDLRERYPAINPCFTPLDFEMVSEHNCRAGGTHLFETDGGWFDPVDALQDLLDANRAAGVEVRLNTEVRRVQVKSGRACGVELSDGTHISSNTVVNAAGPWCNRLFTDLGLEIGWPLEPTRIQVVHLDRPPEVVGDIPVCVDRVAGIYFRLQNRGQQIIVSSVSEDDEQETVADPQDYARYIDDDFIHMKLYALEHRVRGLSVRGLNGYSGLYTINRSDMHPIVGPTSIDGLYAANGCSGHGFKLAPAVGALIARHITGANASFDTDVDLQFLAVNRVPIVLESKSVLA